MSVVRRRGTETEGCFSALFWHAGNRAREEKKSRRKGTIRAVGARVREKIDVAVSKGAD